MTTLIANFSAFWAKVFDSIDRTCADVTESFSECIAIGSVDCGLLPFIANLVMIARRACAAQLAVVHGHRMSVLQEIPQQGGTSRSARMAEARRPWHGRLTGFADLAGLRASLTLAHIQRPECLDLQQLGMCLWCYMGQCPCHIFIVLVQIAPNGPQWPWAMANSGTL